MQINLVRTPEDLIEVVLVADGWKFCGISLYSRPDRFRNAPCRKLDALAETLDRHQYDNTGKTMLDVYGPNPSDDDMLEIVGELNLMFDDSELLNRALYTLNAVQNAVSTRDGRVEETYELIESIIADATKVMHMDSERKSMRTDFIAI